MFTSSDADCPVNAFALKTSNADPALASNPTAEESLNVFIESGSVKLFAKDPGTLNFWIQGSSVSGKFANQPATLVNNCGPNSQDIWLFA